MGIYGHDILHLPVGFLAWLATSDLRLAVYGLRALYGTVRFLHLIGMATFLGAVLLVDLRLLGLFRTAAIDTARPLLVALMHWGFGIAITSGLALFLYDPLGAGLHTMFLPKLILIAVGLLHVHPLRGLAFMRRSLVLRRAAAAVSLVIWVGVVGASTWNHAERPVNINAMLRAATVGKE